jgi:hypothetical protein
MTAKRALGKKYASAIVVDFFVSLPLGMLMPQQ